MLLYFYYLFSPDVRMGGTKQWEQILFRSKIVLFALVVVYFWSEPLCQVSRWGMWPLGWMFSFPLHPTGSIGVLAAVVVCQQGASRVLSLF